MNLTTRLLCFFLGAIAVVLLAFDSALYGLALVHLRQQLTDRLDSALETLCAAVEIHADTVEWEPEERSLSLGGDRGPNRICWTVHDPQGALVDFAANFEGDRTLAQTLVGVQSEAGTIYWQGADWQVAERTLTPHKRPNANPDEHSNGGGQQFANLRMTVACSLAPMERDLRTLGAALAILSSGVWLAAAVVGSRLCRRALAPVLTMTTEAERITPDDLARRLPLSGRGDEVEQLARSFNGLLARVEESYERQRRFTGDASHQLRTPLTVMLGQVEVALRRDRTPQDYVRTLDIVRRRIVELQQITEMLLFLARADAEGQVPEMTVALAGSILAEAAQRWQGHPRGSDLVVEGVSNDRPLSIKIHTPLFAQLLDNLIDNAAKYSAAGSPIRLIAERTKGGIRLAVRDEGSGIPEDELSQLFTPFFRGRAARSSGQAGVGLGLAVAKRIAEALGGSMTAESSLGRGTTVAVVLPDVFETKQPRECVTNEEVLSYSRR